MKKSLILFVAVLVSVVLAMAADITGTWEMTTVSQRGERKQDITFKQTGEKLEVSMMMPGRGGAEPTEIKAEGTVKGNDIEFKIVRTTQRGEMVTIYKGTVVDATHLKGTQSMNVGGQDMTSEWTAVKK